MLQPRTIRAALTPGAEPFIWLVSIFFTIVGGSFLIHIFRQVPTGVYRVQWSRVRGNYTDFRREDDPYLFWGHVICDATYSGLFFLLGLAGIIWSLFHLHGVA